MGQDIKKTKNKVWVQFTLFILLIIAILSSLIASSFFINDNLQPGMVIGGTYQAIIKYEKASNRSEAINTLQDKINPLRRKGMMINRLKGNALNVIVPRGDYKNMDHFLREIERRGSIFFLDEKGNDLLVGTGEKDKFTPSTDKTAKRIILKDFIASESIAPTLIQGQNRPGINFKIKKLEIYNAIVKIQEDNPVFIWQDFGQMLDEIRNNQQDLIKFRNFINSKTASLKADSAQELKKALRELLKATVINNNDGTTKIVEFGIPEVSDTEIYNYFKDNQVIYKEVRSYNKDYDNRDLTIDINDEDDVYSKQQFLNPFRPYLKELVEETFKEQEEYKNKYLITSSALALKDDMAVIEMAGEEAATSLAKVFSAGVRGINYQVESFAVTDYLENHPEIKDIIYIALGIISFLVVVILSIFYRVFGFIFSIILFLMVMTTMLTYNMLVGIYGWEILIALIIGMMLAISAGVTLLAKLKVEFNSGKSLKQSFLDANRKTISIFFDLATLLLIVSFFIFWFSIGIIKSFSIMLIIINMANILFTMLLTRLVYFSLVSFSFVNHHSKLVIANFDSLKLKFNTLKISKFSAFFNKFFVKTPYQKVFKWIILATSIIITCGVIVASVVGPGTSLEFEKGTIFQVELKSGNNLGLQKEDSLKNQIIRIQDQIITKLKNDYGKYYYNVTIFKQLENNNYNIVIKTSLVDNPQINKLQDWLSSNNYDSKIDIENVSSSLLINETSRQIIINGVTVMAIAVGVVGVYLLLRFDWPAALTMVLTIIHELLLASAFLIIVRLEVTVEIIIALLAVIIFSFIKKLIIFDYIRENKTINNNDNDVQALTTVIDEGFKLSFRNTLISSFFTLLLLFTLFIFKQNIGSVFTLCISIIVISISTSFLLRTVWIYFAKVKIKRKINKKEKIYKSIIGIDEQIVLGIND